MQLKLHEAWKREAHMFSGPLPNIHLGTFPVSKFPVKYLNKNDSKLRIALCRSLDGENIQ